VLCIRLCIFLHLIVILAHNSFRKPGLLCKNGTCNGVFNFTSRYSGAFGIVCIIHDQVQEQPVRFLGHKRLYIVGKFIIFFPPLGLYYQGELQKLDKKLSVLEV
jgi:hypothetical protein